MKTVMAISVSQEAVAYLRSKGGAVTIFDAQGMSLC